MLYSAFFIRSVKEKHLKNCFSNVLVLLEASYSCGKINIHTFLHKELKQLIKQVI